MSTSIITLEKFQIIKNGDDDKTTFQITNHNGNIVFEKFYPLTYTTGYTTYKTEKNFRDAIKRMIKNN